MPDALADLERTLDEMFGSMPDLEVPPRDEWNRGYGYLLVDTDMLIDHLRGRRRSAGDGRVVAVSAVTRCELFAGGDESGRLRELLGRIVELPLE